MLRQGGRDTADGRPHCLESFRYDQQPLSFAQLSFSRPMTSESNALILAGNSVVLLPGLRDHQPWLGLSMKDVLG